MINFTLLSIIGAILVGGGTLVATMSATFLYNNPPDSQVLKVWDVNTKQDGQENNLLSLIYEIVESLEGSDNEKKIKEFNDKMLRLGMEMDYKEMRRESTKGLVWQFAVELVLAMVGIIAFMPLFFIGFLSMFLSAYLFMKPVLDINKAIKKKNKQMKTELLSILDSFKIFNKAGLLNNIVKDNVDMLSASRNDLLILQATLESEGELVAFSELGERVGTELYKEFTSLVKTAIQGADATTLIVNIKALEDGIYQSLEEDMKYAAVLRWKMVTAMLIVIFIPLLLIFGAPIIYQINA